MCHRHLDSDIGESDLNSLRASGTVPTSTAILSTSPGKYPILWRVLGFSFTQRESTLKLRTIVLGSYLDCTGATGFSTSKDCRASTIRNEHHAFASPNPIAKASPWVTNFEHDWLWILHALAHVNGVMRWLQRSLQRECRARVLRRY